MKLFNFLNTLHRFFPRLRDFWETPSNTSELTTAQTKDMQKNLPEISEALYWSKQKLQQMRNERLKKLLIHAKSYSPWYQKSLAHIDLDNFTEQKLNELPVMNKKILMDNWDEIVTNRKLTLEIAEKHLEKMTHDEDTLYLLNRYHVLATSGSSGKRGVFIYDWDEWNKHYSFFIRYPYYNQARTDVLTAQTTITKIVQVVVCNTVFALYSLAKTYKFNNIEMFYLPVTLPMHQIVEGLNHIQADILKGTPSTIYKLCQEANEGRLKIQPTTINVTGEPLYKPIRALIQKIWPNAKVFNIYGASEGIIGMNCRANSEQMHLNEDACIVEPLDEWNNPINKGVKSSKLYLTNLYNYTLPLIRYEMSDQLVFLDKTCDCGIQHQLIDEPQGRPEFDFTYSGNIFVHHLLFVTSLLLEKNIQEYQVIQTHNGADIRVLLIGHIDKDKLKNNISNKLNKLGLSEPKINIIEVIKFDYPSSGKLKRFVKIN